MSGGIQSRAGQIREDLVVGADTGDWLAEGRIELVKVTSAVDVQVVVHEEAAVRGRRRHSLGARLHAASPSTAGSH